jgi:hypothetical protein
MGTLDYHLDEEPAAGVFASLRSYSVSDFNPIGPIPEAPRNPYIRLTYPERTGRPDKYIDLQAPDEDAPPPAPTLPSFSPFPICRLRIR